MTVTLRYQSTGAIPGKGDPVVLRGPNLTIGRGDENDLVLPDPDRLLSKRHCVVEDHNGNVVVVDISTNGTFLNYGKIALGGTPTPINDGDILSLGPYELLVEISTDRANDPTANIADPVSELQVSPGDSSNADSMIDLLDGNPAEGDFLDDLLGEGAVPAGPKGVKRVELGEDGLLPPLGEGDGISTPEDDLYAGHGASQSMHSPSPQDNFLTQGIEAGANVIPDDWDDDLMGGEPAAGAKDPFARPIPAPVDPGPGAQAFIPEEEQPVAPIAQVVEEVVEPTPPSPPVAAAPAQTDAARAFLKALDADGLNIADGELTTTMAQLGKVFQVMVHGLREILMTRTSIKSEFRIDQTQIGSGANNPLKFSVSPEQAIQALVQPTVKGYLDPVDATEQALSDIKAHEVAMITGMQAALKGVLGRLDPAVLEEKLAKGGGRRGILKSKKTQYWEIYEEMYAEISDQAENDFHDLFSREFANAYKEQLERLK